VPHLRAFPTAREVRDEPATAAANLRRTVENRVVERFAPAHVVVNQEGDIIHFSPRTGKYLEPATGLPNRHLLAMARRGLRLDLRAALREAVEGRTAVTRQHVEVELEERKQFIDLTIEPLGTADDPLFLVLFRDVGPPTAVSEPHAPSIGGAAPRTRANLIRSCVIRANDCSQPSRNTRPPSRS
jgi:two-component system CheB/CheR fusion protein